MDRDALTCQMEPWSLMSRASGIRLGGKDGETRLGIEAELRIQAKVDIMGQVEKAKKLGTEHKPAEFPLFSMAGKTGEVGWGCTHTGQLNL